MISTFAITVLLLTCSSVAAPVSDNAPTVTVDAGVVVGTQTTVTSKAVNQYLGVPFAASPTRFSPPQTATPWSSPYDASKRGPACIQQFNYPEASRNFSMAAFNTPPPEESEDCLSVNVFVPAGSESSSSLKPVMFWIYGGSLAFGYNGNAVYDGSSFAANQDVILVATNYRTNVFGFPGATGLPLTERNLGYLDQRFALGWVQRNIEAFGGDPSQVTIFGESAGAFSVDALVTSFTPANPPPFHAAIMESGQSSVSPLVSSNGSTWSTLISRLNCTEQGYDDELECARNTPASTLKLVEEQLALSFQPTADNVTFLRYPNIARRNGEIYPTPILTGSNADEGTLFTFSETNTTEFLTSTIPGITSQQTQLIESVYPVGPDSYTSSGAPLFNDTLQIAAINTDLVFQCPCSIVANTSSSAGIPTWRYFYNSTFPDITPVPGVALPYYFGVFHSSEIALVFGTYGIFSQVTGNMPTEQEVKISQYMQTAWAGFARNPSSGPGWESAQDGYVQVIGGKDGYAVGGEDGLFKAGQADVLDGGRCRLWEPVYNLTTGY